MRKSLLLLLLTPLLFAKMVDVRIVGFDPNTAAALSNVIQEVATKANVSVTIATGKELFTLPDFKKYSGVLFIFNATASFGGVKQDREMAYRYANLILEIAKHARVAIVFLEEDKAGRFAQHLARSLGLLIDNEVSLEESERPLKVLPLHPVIKGVDVLPKSCDLIPIAYALIKAESSVGVQREGRTDYCFAVVAPKGINEILVISFKGSLKYFSGLAGGALGTGVAALLENLLKYLAGQIPTKYPAIYITTVTKTVTYTTTQTVVVPTISVVTMTITNTVTSVKTVFNTVTVTTTLTETYTTTFTSVLFSTSYITKTLTTTVLKTVTSYITNTTTVVLTSSITLTKMITKTLTKTLIRTFTSVVYNTVTTTVEKTNYLVSVGMGIAGFVVGAAIMSFVLGRGGKKEEEEEEGGFAEKWGT